MPVSREEILEGIRQNPTDYVRRQIYADWLDERGEHEEATRQRNYEKAEGRCRRFADKIDVGYSFLMRHADDHIEGSDDGWDYIYMGENEGYKDASEEDWNQFWIDYETLTGRKLADGRYKSLPFSCSC